MVPVNTVESDNHLIALTSRENMKSIARLTFKFIFTQKCVRNAWQKGGIGKCVVFRKTDRIF